MLLFVYRSALPIFLALLSISVGLFLAFIFTYLIFGKVHLFTLVFGASLIGVSIDYTFHFLTNRLSQGGELGCKKGIKRDIPSHYSRFNNKPDRLFGDVCYIIFRAATVICFFLHRTFICIFDSCLLVSVIYKKSQLKNYTRLGFMSSLARSLEKKICTDRDPFSS